ncbi:hypothetical protein G9A89_014616 [Geosiphon pyriformis]|nr:hypothetical protein G9A89_014616 [Geosiphon pyriformis]
MASTYITKISEFTGEDSETSSQEWLDKVSKARDANGWNAARMLKAILYFLQEMASKWFENLEAPPEYWEAFKTAFLEQRIQQLETNEYYFNAQILDQFIAGLKDKLIKKVCPHAPEDLATAIQQTKNYEMAIEEANHTKLINLAIGKTSSAAEEKIDQLTKKLSYNARRTGFHHTALSEGRAAAQQQNPSHNHTTIPSTRIAKNTNLFDIFLFKFKANESSFLLSNAAANKQKAITTMYTEAEVEGKTIYLILDSGSTRSIITYQLIQQLKRNVDRPAQTVIVTADDMKKTPVGEIDNFLFTLDGITIPVKVLVMDAPQYQALVGNDWL